MFTALLAGVFFVLIFWFARRERHLNVQLRQSKEDTARTQADLQAQQHRVQQLIGLLTALPDHKVSPLGRVSWTELAEFAVQSGAPLVGVETVVLLVWHPDYSEFRPVAGRGVPPQLMKALRIRLGEGLLGKAAEDGKAIQAQEPASGTNISGDALLNAPYIILPLRVQGQVKGLIVFVKPADGRWGADAMRLATLLAKYLEVSLDNLDLYETRQQVYAQLVETLALAFSANDARGREHAENCRGLVRGMAREMKLPAMITEQIEFAALLHDVGKAGVSDAILGKKGPLDDAEWAAIKKHPQTGYDILRKINFLRGIAPMVLYHHEWVNGQGYPEGLAGEEIPLGARMIAILDAWDTMTTNQPYRAAMSKNNAVAELRQQAGTQFDPKLVDIFLHVILAAQPHA